MLEIYLDDVLQYIDDTTPFEFAITFDWPGAYYHTEFKVCAVDLAGNQYCETLQFSDIDSCFSSQSSSSQQASTDTASDSEILEQLNNLD